MAPTTRAESPAQRLHSLATGYWLSKALAVAAELGVADEMVDGAVDSEELARITDTDPDRLYRLLRALASVGLFSEVRPRAFGLTPLGDPLRSDHPESVRALAAMVGQESFDVWTRLGDSLRGGPPAFEEMFGAPFYAYLASNPHGAATFNRAIAERHHSIQPEVPDALDLGGSEWIVDIGAGTGQLAADLLGSYPDLRLTAIERADVCAAAGETLAQFVEAGRASVEEGDFFSELPSGADLYLIASVLHNWDDEGARRILRTCRDAMTPSSRLAIVELVVPHGDEPHFSKLLDLHVMLLMGGRERTEVEHRTLLESEGLRAVSVRPAGRMTVIGASRAIDQGVRV